LLRASFSAAAAAMFVDDAGGASGVTCWAGVAQPQASSVDVAGCRLHD